MFSHLRMHYLLFCFVVACNEAPAVTQVEQAASSCVVVPDTSLHGDGDAFAEATATAKGHWPCEQAGSKVKRGIVVSASARASVKKPYPSDDAEQWVVACSEVEKVAQDNAKQTCDATLHGRLRGQCRFAELIISKTNPSCSIDRVTTNCK